MNHETDVSHAFKDGVNATLIDDPKNEVARFFNEVNCKFCGAELYAFPCQNDETTYWRCGTDHSDERGYDRSWSCYEKERSEFKVIKAEVERLRAEVTLYKGYTRGFGILHCAAYGEAHFGKKLLHPEHYDLLEKAGCRMDAYKKATLNPTDK